MRPIHDAARVRPSSVLWHSAFGFARVRAVEEGEVVLDWERPAEHLPYRVGIESLARVYAACEPDGFFDQALNARDALREAMQVDPPTCLGLLLADLDGPQQVDDLRDWILGRGLLSDDTWPRWWDRVQAEIASDPRFRTGEDGLWSYEDADTDPIARLDDPRLAPDRRLEIAVAHRGEIGEERFVAHALAAYRGGNARVRDLALAHVGLLGPEVVLPTLVASGDDGIEAAVHAIRNAGWSAADLPPSVVRAVLDRIERALDRDGPLDAEGRLAAAAWRWGLPALEGALCAATKTTRGQMLVDAALAALPGRRAEALAVVLADAVIAAAPDSPAARFLVGRLTAISADSPERLAESLRTGHPSLAARLSAIAAGGPSPAEEPTMETEEGPATAELPRDTPPAVPLSELPARPGATFLLLGGGLARALARHHAAGRVVTPTRDTVRLAADGTVEVSLGGDPRVSARPPGEGPSKCADVYAAGVILIEALIGRTWPRNLSADRAIPFLRHIAPDLPPSAIAPLAIAVDPIAAGRPLDSVAWLLKWQAALTAEEERSATAHDTRTRLRVGFDTHVGRMKILHTQTNQDSLFVSTKGPLSLLAVCDGISTANTGSGDLAAGISTQVIASLWDQWLPRLANHKPDDAQEYLDRALRLANQAVCEASLRLAGGELAGRVPMGTTAVVAVAQGNLVSIAWLGDSRAFVVGPYGASQLTADANQAGERMIEWFNGSVPTFDATGFALVRYVGHFDDEGNAEPLGALHTSLVLLPGERLVVCSDGISDYVADSQAEVCAVIGGEVANADPDDAARRLIELANRGGGGDNATVIVATALSG
jgi:protein phosphatase